MKVGSNVEKSKPGIVYNLHYVMKPCAALYCIFGLLKFTSDGKKYKFISPIVKIYSLMLSFVLAIWEVYSVTDRYNFISNKKGNDAALLDFLTFVPPLLTGFVSIIISALIGSEMVVKFHENLDMIDDSLSFPKMKTYRLLRIKYVAAQVGFLLFVIGGFSYNITKNFRHATILWYVVCVILDLLCIEFIMYVSIMKTRLKMVNDKLKEFYNQMANGSILLSMSKINTIYKTPMALYRQSANFPPTKTNSDDPITLLTKVYEKIADNAYILNSFYGLPILLFAASTFSIIIISINTLINWQKSNENTFSTPTIACMWTVQCIFYTLVSIYYCESLQGERTKSSAIIEKISTQLKLDEKEQKLLNRFSIVINCRHMRITACNFFPYDFSYLHSLASAIIGYTIILIQEAPNSSNNQAAISNYQNKTEKQ